MARIEITKAADDWFGADKKNRSGLVLLGEVLPDGTHNASMCAGYDAAIIANTLLFGMVENEPLAEIVLTVCEEYKRRKAEEN